MHTQILLDRLQLENSGVPIYVQLREQMLRALGAGELKPGEQMPTMRELAVALKMDPVEPRRRNDTMKEPIKGPPYTSRALMACFDAAAKDFGWAKRQP